MKICKEIEEKLSLYLDNMLSAEDKLAVEEHLKSCSDCPIVLVQLQKTKNLVNNLAEVETPAWFQQRIMAKVRREAGKGSFVRKLFYPLRIKIPVQIFAAIFISVLAVYVYRAGEEEVQKVVPLSTPATVTEVPQGKIPEPRSVPALVTKEKVAVSKGAGEGKIAESEPSASLSLPKPASMKRGVQSENTRERNADMLKDVKESDLSISQVNKRASISMNPVESFNVQSAKKKGTNIIGATAKKSKAPPARSEKQETSILLRVADISAAGSKVEKLLLELEAKNINKRRMPDKTILTAELKNQEVINFTERLSKIGQVETGAVFPDNTETNIFVVINIFSE